MRRIILILITLTTLASISSSDKTEARELLPMKLCFHNNILYDSVAWWQPCPGTNGDTSILKQHHETGFTSRGSFHPELMATNNDSVTAFEAISSNSGITKNSANAIIIHQKDDDHEDCEILYQAGF